MFAVHKQAMSTQDPFGIYSWQRISDVVTTSGRLVASDIDDIARLGVRHVIDLTPRSHENTLQDEQERLAEKGISHLVIEVPFNRPTEEHYQQFKQAYEASQLPLHVHCIYNYRTSAFLYRYHLETGMPQAEARALMMEHWSPDKSDHPAAQPWKEFIQQTERRYQERRLAS